VKAGGGAPLRVLHVATEVHPFVKTGGLADVIGALPAAQAAAGADVRLLLPGLTPLTKVLREARPLGTVMPPWGGAPAELVEGRLDAPPLSAVRAVLVRHDGLYARPGTPYGDGTGHAFADNHRRFALLGLAAARLAEGLDRGWAPQVVHGHDWHAGLASAYVAFSRGARRHRAGSVFTIHNLAYQGLFDQRLFVELGLPLESWSLQGLEFHGQLSYLKAGLHYADRITTVSPTYAREIQGPEFGAGLDGLLRERSQVLCGILNGVDDSVWDPGHDGAIAETFSADRPAGKGVCKAALQRECGLEERPEALLFTAVSRLTEQKGLQLLPGLVDELVAHGGQLVVLGSGDAALEAALRQVAAAHPRAVALRQGHDEALAHRIFAGSDVTLVPSRFEPCGLTQMYALRYGSLPLVRRTGGLADTVVDCTLEDLADGRATGFVFERFEAGDLQRALRRAFTLWARPRDWRAVRRRGMQQRFGWGVAAARYAELYDGLVRELSA
jgi:starch synthase